jgi:hypothetical protein
VQVRVIVWHVRRPSARVCDCVATVLCLLCDSYPAMKAAVDSFNAANRWRKQGVAVMPVKYCIQWVGYNASTIIRVYSQDGTVEVSTSRLLAREVVVVDVVVVVVVIAVVLVVVVAVVAASLRDVGLLCSRAQVVWRSGRACTRRWLRLSPSSSESTSRSSTSCLRARTRRRACASPAARARARPALWCDDTVLSTRALGCLGRVVWRAVGVRAQCHVRGCHCGCCRTCRCIACLTRHRGCRRCSLRSARATRSTCVSRT